MSPTPPLRSCASGGQNTALRSESARRAPGGRGPRPRRPTMGEHMGGRFEGKVSIVTGAGQGIGEAYAKGLADDGASVVVADLNTDQAKRVAAEIEAAGGAAAAVAVDVSDPASAQARVDEALARYGGVHHLVNNAAIYHSMRMDNLLTVDLDYFYRFMSVNLYGALHCARAVVPAMEARGGG